MLGVRGCPGMAAALSRQTLVFKAYTMALVEADRQAVCAILRQRSERRGAQERRSRNRRDYPVIEIVAPYRGCTVPRRSEFCEVVCQDISSGGVAFCWPTAPDFEHLVIGLGEEPKLYLTARVAHFGPCADRALGFLVGCRFLGRVSVPN